MHTNQCLRTVFTIRGLKPAIFVENVNFFSGSTVPAKSENLDDFSDSVSGLFILSLRLSTESESVHAGRLRMVFGMVLGMVFEMVPAWAQSHSAIHKGIVLNNRETYYSCQKCVKTKMCDLILSN